jgi:hypothetical protein
VWLVIAAGLAVFVYFEPRLRLPPPTPMPVLPGLDVRGVTNISILPLNADEISAEVTNGGWRLVRPVDYPAQAAGPAALLAALEKLMPEATLSGRELRERPDGVASYGLEPAQLSVTLLASGTRHQLQFGSRTAPGDQVFMQVVGTEGVFVVGADIMKLLPTTAAAWRDPALIDLRSLSFNRITVTNGPTVIDLQLVSTNQTWRMTRPRAQRVDGERMADLIANLVQLRARQFVTDDPAADRESFGLQPPALSVAFSLGTNLNTLLHFGKSPTNDTKLVFARRQGLSSVVAVDKGLIGSWLAPVNEYRDRQLLALETQPDLIEFRGGAGFSLQRHADGTWRVAGQDFRLDAAAVAEILAAITNLTITNFVQDVVIDPDLPKFGLATPSREVRIYRTLNTTAGVTNALVAALSFGSQQDGRIFVRRSDEDSVYEVALAGFERLPVSPLQLRERRLWNFSEDDVARVTTAQDGQRRTVVRLGTNSWSLAPGSQGEIFSEAIEETVHRLGELSALAWVGRGETNLGPFGFSTNNIALAIELKNGTKHAVNFGGPSPGGYPCASIQLDGEPWICEIPIGLHYLVRTHLGLSESAR